MSMKKKLTKIRDLYNEGDRVGAFKLYKDVREQVYRGPMAKEEEEFKVFIHLHKTISKFGKDFAHLGVRFEDSEAGAVKVGIENALESYQTIVNLADELMGYLKKLKKVK